MKHQATLDLFRYWNDLRGERATPERNDIDPGAIRHILADTFMLGIDADRRFPFRLAGTRVNALFDAEQKGRSFLDLWASDDRGTLRDLVGMIADDPCPVVIGASAAPAGRDACAFELLLLPMRHHGRTHSRVLGLVRAASRPSWLGLLPIGPFRLDSLRIIDADEAERLRPSHVPPRRAAACTVADLAVGRLAPLRLAGGRPVLRVIDGGRVGRRRSDILEVEVENRHL